ncbi:MAG: HAMP domain-containing histidine kinase [Clostridia bacterium]|nr:HAMP domain-containing histidine kinase [Clostridia bacterium]
MKTKNKRVKNKSNLFRRYFGVSALTVLLGFMFIGFVMMFFVAGQWWTDKVDVLTRNAQNIAGAYSTLDENGFYSENDDEMIKNALRFMHEATLSDYFITDIQGDVIFCCDADMNGINVCAVHRSLTVSEEHMKRAMDGGFTDYTTEDEFGIGKFVVAVPIKHNGEVVAVTYAVEDAITGFLPYVAGIVQSMSYTILLALIVVFIAMYFTTKGITKPLSEMQEVTTHFAKGEFSHRANEDYTKKDFSNFAKALNKMADELRISDESQKSFVANVSHELKTPMTSIGGFIDGILDGTIPPEEERKYLSIVSSEVKRLSRMVVSMLNLSKIEAGEVQLAPTVYDVSKQIFDTLLSFERKIDEKKINIEGFEDMGSVNMKADKDLIQQVIYNLLDNAVKFTPDNGTITVFANNDGECTRVRIRNSGAGVTEEEISRIFERFYKVDKSRSFDTKGVGLGLYIVKTIINMHDGDITADSKQGEYTEFAFEIPFSQ